METSGKVDLVFRNGGVFHKRLLFYFIIKVRSRRINCLKMKYFQLKNEYHQWTGLEKLRKNHVSIITIAGIPLEIGRSKSLKSADNKPFSVFQKL